MNGSQLTGVEAQVLVEEQRMLLRWESLLDGRISIACKRDSHMHRVHDEVTLVEIVAALGSCLADTPPT